MDEYVLKTARDVASIQSRLDTGTQMFERINDTLERLSDVQASLKEVMVSHTERLRSVELGNEQRAQAELRVHDSYREELIKLEDRVIKKIEDTNKAISEIAHEQKNTNESVNERLRRIERWKWGVIGAALVVGYLFKQFGGLMLIATSLGG